MITSEGLVMAFMSLCWNKEENGFSKVLFVFSCLL